MIQLLDVVTLVSIGLMVGAELSIAAFIHPALYRLREEAHVPVAAALARLFGRVMPPWYAANLLLALAQTFLRWHQSGRAPELLATSAFLLLLMILYSVIIEVPINNRVAEFSVGELPADWKMDRQRWDFHHRWRVLILVAAFTLLATSLT